MNEYFIEGSLFKLKLNIFGIASWNKRWFAIDSKTEEIYHFKCTSSPGSDIQPRSSLYLPNCTIEPSTERPFAFKITDASRNKQWTLAANSLIDLEKWNKFISNLTSQKEDRQLTQSNKLAKNSKNEIQQKMEVDMDVKSKKQIYNVEEKINNYFEKKMKKNPNMLIQQSDLQPLISFLDASMNLNKFVEYFNDKISYEGNSNNISIKQFCEVWNHIESINLAFKSQGSHIKCIEFFSNQERWISSREYLDNLCNHFGSVINETHEYFSFPIHFTGYLYEKIKDFPAEVMIRRKALPIDNVISKRNCDFSSEWNKVYQRFIDEIYSISTNRKDNSKELLELHLSIYALKGKFNKLAIEAVKKIIYELTLPLNLKSIKSIKVLNSECIYHINGLILKMENKLSDEIPISKNPIYFRAESEENILKKKISGHEYSASHWVESCFSSNISTIDIRVPLSTVIDYCGFRFSVFPEVDINETITLVHGMSVSESVFVNCAPGIDGVVPTLAAKLGLVHIPRLLVGRSEVNDEDSSDKCRVDYIFCNTLSKNLQFHKSSDERIYITNLLNLRPPFIPRKNSFDVFTHKLRPELMKKIKSSLSNVHVSPQSFEEEDRLSIDLKYSFFNHEAMVKDTGSKTALLNLITSKTKELLESDKKLLSDTLTEEAIKPSGYLYMTILPETIQILDSLAFLPLDSYGLTKFLHERGVNMFCLGFLYRFSYMPHVKQILLVEIVARSCKVYLNSLLHAVHQKARSLSIGAEKRGRSGEKDFTQHQSQLFEELYSIILDLFNSLLGSQEKTHYNRQVLWSEILPRIIFTKFSLQIEGISQSLITHLPLLFSSLKYHLSITFLERPDYELGTSDYPFTASDILEFDEKLKVNDPIFYGQFHDNVDALSSFLASKMYHEAMSIYRMQLSAINLTYPDSRSSIVISRTNELYFKIVLCKYLNRDYEGSIKDLRSAITKNFFLSVYGARMLTLAMCVEFKLGNMKSAIKYYEYAKQAFEYSLGEFHPALNILYCSLADLYYDDKYYSHAKVMIALAHDHSCKTLGDTHIVSVGYSTKLATVLMHQNHYYEALDIFLFAYNIYLDLTDEFLNDVKECLSGITVCLWKLGRHEEAQKYYSILIEICKVSEKN